VEPSAAQTVIASALKSILAIRIEFVSPWTDFQVGVVAGKGDDLPARARSFFDVWVHYADLFDRFRGVNQISNGLLGLANRKRSARNEAHRLIPYGAK
jgi:hypothetical protein